jgi:hypothetical protein
LTPFFATMRLLFILALSLIGFVPMRAQSQTVLEKEMSISFTRKPLDAALEDLAKLAQLDLVYSNSLLPVKTITGSWVRTPVRKILSDLLANTNLSYRWSNGQLVLVKNTEQIVNSTLQSPRPIRISGYIESQTSGERLIQATIYDVQSGLGALSNEFGFYSLSLPPGVVQLQISYLGQTPISLPLKLSRDTFLTFKLKDRLLLDSVVVRGEGSRSRLQGEDFYGNGLDLSQIDKMPKMAGENDLVRAIQLMPGVQAGPDGIGGFFVRGGEAGQNLVIIDDVPMYNTNHAAGVLSIFNSDIIKSAELLKGAFPARYAGRLSSVLDIRTRDGNKHFWEGSGSIGLVSSRLTLEGPIVKDKSSLLLSGRFSTLNWLMKPYSQNYKAGHNEKGETGYKFYDFNAKFNAELSPRNRIYLSFFRGLDRFSNGGAQEDTLLLRDQAGFLGAYRLYSSYQEFLTWRNTGGAFRWNRMHNNKLFSNTTLTFSELRVEIGSSSRDTLRLLSPNGWYSYSTFDGGYRSRIQDFGLRSDFHWSLSPQHYVRFGGRVQQNIFVPGIREYSEEFRDEIEGRDPVSRRIRTQGWSLYAEDEWRPNDDLRIDYGLNWSAWAVDGKLHSSMEPRIAAYYRLGERNRLKASFSRMAQFLHLLTGANIGLPTDLWVPSTGAIRPGVAWQSTLGYDQKIGETWEMGVELYHKNMQNLISYSEGAGFLDDWERNVTVGEGEATGLDFSLRKSGKKVSGFASYSFANTERTFPKINLGRPYPFRYDHRHDLKINAQLKASSKVDFSATWVYGSGLAFSSPQSKFTFLIPGETPNPIDVTTFGPKNGRRMPPYHRLDLAANFHFGQNKKIRHDLQISVYNAYNRRNPLYYKIVNRPVAGTNGNSRENEVVSVYLLPILPGFSYVVGF